MRARVLGAIQTHTDAAGKVDVYGAAHDADVSHAEIDCALHEINAGMSKRMLGELGTLFIAESDALRGAYAWPPKNVTPEEAEEAKRLYEIGCDLFAKADATSETT